TATTAQCGSVNWTSDRATSSTATFTASSFSTRVQEWGSRKQR
ncbi:unnamed protein product, partial [Pylaiella littoralis]